MTRACVALLPDGQRRHHGQDRDDRVRQPSRRPDDQPAQSRAYAGWLLVGFGRSGSRRARAAGLRHPDRRFGDPAGRLLRRRWATSRPIGDFNRVGIKMQCHSVDTLGLMARTLDDIALFRAAVLKLPPVAHRSRHRPAAHRPLPLAGVGQGRSRDQGAYGGDRDPALRQGRRRWSTWPSQPPFTDIIDDHAAITGFESVRNYADERLRNPDKVSDELMNGPMKRGLAVSFERYVAAQRKATAFKAHVDSLFDKVDCCSDAQRAGRGAEGPRRHRRSGLQFDLDPGRHPLCHPAGRDWPATACRSVSNSLANVTPTTACFPLAAWVAAHLN